MNGSNQDAKFERCHGGGQAYETYKSIQHKFTDEFNTLTFELMVETYLKYQMGSNTLSDRDFVNLQNIWRSIAEELGVLGTYPYPITEFAHAHPRSQDAAREAKRRLGIV